MQTKGSLHLEQVANFRYLNQPVSTVEEIGSGVHDSPKHVRPNLTLQGKRVICQRRPARKRHK